MVVATRWPLVGRRDEVDAFRRALRDAGCEAFCIYGPPGVGKSRLADECLELARSTGRRALRATADLSTEPIPFGAVAHLMPAHALEGLGTDVLDPIAFVKLYDSARRVLVPAPDESGVPVLLLDDAHALDAASLLLVDRLVGQRKLFCIATVVTGTSVTLSLARRRFVCRVLAALSVPALMATWFMMAPFLPTAADFQCDGNSIEDCVKRAILPRFGPLRRW
jgi:hypothetical protein